MSNRTYDILKWIALLFLPAIATLYYTLSRIWDLPYCEETVGTITALDAFLGALIGVSCATYDAYNTNSTNSDNTNEGR